MDKEEFMQRLGELIEESKVLFPKATVWLKRAYREACTHYMDDYEVSSDDD